MASTRIVFIDQYGSLGGGQQILLELVNSACNLACTVEVLIPEGGAAEKLRHEQIAVTLIEECALQQRGKNIYDILKWIIYSIKICIKNIAVFKMTDLIYVNGSRLLFVATVASFFLRKKAVYHIHLHHRGVEYRLFRSLLLFRMTQALIVPSAFIRRQLPQSETRIITVENGLDARFLDVAYQDRFKNAPLRHAAIVGRISPEKGQDILLTLAPAFPDMTFHIFGDAGFSDDAYYRDLVCALPSNVIFHGWVDDVLEKVDQFQVQLWIVPSRVAESSSLVCMQGAATSCIVAVREEGALADMADELGLPRFRTDEDMAHLLGQLRDCSPRQLAHKTSIVFQKTMAHYSHGEFQKRLTNLLRHLVHNCT